MARATATRLPTRNWRRQRLNPSGYRGATSTKAWSSTAAYSQERREWLKDAKPGPTEVFDPRNPASMSGRIPRRIIPADVRVKKAITNHRRFSHLWTRQKRVA